MENCMTLLESQERWNASKLAETRLSNEDAIKLYKSADFHELRRIAHVRRMKMLPTDEVTYMIDRNVNYTNVCTINCQFCSFYRPPDHEETYTQTFQQISARIVELEEIGGVRILMQGGVNPELSIEWYEKLLKFLKENHPNIDLDCFSPVEIRGISEIAKISTLDVLKRLQKAGLHGLPGGGAEMLVDNIRLDASPKKGVANNWIKVMQEAQSIGLITSATNVFGFGETLEQRVQHLDKIRHLQDKSIEQFGNGFTSFIAWPVQLEINSFGKRKGGRNRFELKVGPIEYLRHLAISRLYLDNIPHIQASWPTMGLDVAQMGLFGGADDIGSTMMEENVVAASGTTKVLASEHELQQTISRAGFKPRRRNSRYELLQTPSFNHSLGELPSPVPAQNPPLV